MTSPQKPVPQSPLPGFEERVAQRQYFLRKIIVWVLGVPDRDPRTADEWCAGLRADLGPGAERFIPEGAAITLESISGLPKALGAALARLSTMPAAPALTHGEAFRSLDDFYQRARMIRTGDDYARMAWFLARHRRSSMFNNLMVYTQMPEATAWDDARRWVKEGRSIREGATPLMILQPFGPIRIVFDVSDTEGPPLPRRAGLFAAEGLLDPKRMRRLRKRCEKEHLEVREITYEDGRCVAGFAWVDSTSTEWDAHVVLQMRVDPRAAFVTLCHEVAHILLGHCGPDPRAAKERRPLQKHPSRRKQRTYDRWSDRQHVPRHVQEIEAESVAFLVASRLGLIAANAEYLAGYIDDTDAMSAISVEHVVHAAAWIDDVVMPARERSDDLYEGLR